MVAILVPTVAWGAGHNLVVNVHARCDWDRFLLVA